MGRDFRAWRKIEKYGLTEKQAKFAIERNAAIDGVYRGLWSANIVDAKQYNLPFISELYGTKIGPVLVCGAGPSLEKNKDAIVAAYKKGWSIVCTDRALHEVRQMGVKEDFSVTTECQPECGDFLKSAGAGDMVVVNLISSPETRKTLIERGCKVYNTAPMSPYDPFWNYIYGEDFWGENVGCARPHLIVTFSTVDICYWMGWDKIVTIGNDLCYEDPFSCSEDTALYQDGSHAHIRMLADGRWTFPMFEEAALGFTCFPEWHPDTEFVDASFGISPWPKKRLDELVGEA